MRYYTPYDRTTIHGIDSHSVNATSITEPEARALEVVPYFAIPFGFAKLDHCDALNGPLRELFLRRAAEGAAYANPNPLTQRNRRVFESEFQVFRWPDRCVQQLKEFCWHQMMRMIGQLNGYDAAALGRMLISSDSWFHVTRRGGFFALHNHPNASWSGVYCVDPGKHDPDKPESGLLSFVNPAVTSAMYMDAANLNLRGAFAYHIRHVLLEPGQLVLFPSWVLHDVKPFEGEGERITVSFNCWFAFQDPAAPAR
jgi:uncharacterized protein (TIGR02466 family)